MNIFQKIYDAIKNFQPPQWVKNMLSDLQTLMLSILKSAGQAYLQYLQTKIIEASQNKNWTSREKFDYVFKQAKNGFVEFGVVLKDNELNVLINTIYSTMKSKGIVQ